MSPSPCTLALGLECVFSTLYHFAAWLCFVNVQAAAYGCAAAVTLFLPRDALEQLVLSAVAGVNEDFSLACTVRLFPSAVAAALFSRVGGLLRVCRESSCAVPCALLHSMLRIVSHFAASHHDAFVASSGLSDLAVELLYLLLPPLPRLDYKHDDALLLALLHGNGADVSQPVWIPLPESLPALTAPADVVTAVADVLDACVRCVDHQGLLWPGMSAVFIAACGRRGDFLDTVLIECASR